CAFRDLRSLGILPCAAPRHALGLQHLQGELTERMPSNDLSKATRVLSRRIDELARVSDERGATTRTFLSPAMRRANAVVGKWMRQAGLSVCEDGVGNLIGTRASSCKGAK